MTANNNKHGIVSRTTQLSQEIALLLEMIYAVSDISTISSHVATK